jgi:hypothetical protein
VSSLAFLGLCLKKRDPEVRGKCEDQDAWLYDGKKLNKHREMYLPPARSPDEGYVTASADVINGREDVWGCYYAYETVYLVHTIANF